MVFDYFAGAAGQETAAALNCTAVEAVRLQPRALVDVGKRHIAKRFMGVDYALPFGVAPMAMCNLAWPGADTMLAAEAMGRPIPHCLSTASSTSLEQIATASQGRSWFQLYVGPTIEIADRMIDRAEAAGYEVLVLTIDVPELSRRLRDIRNGFHLPFRIGPRQFLDLALHPHWSVATLMAGAPKPANLDIAERGRGFVRGESRGAVDWAYLDRLRDRWKKTLIVKGIMHPDDALRCRAAGADAIWVSNHGGRQLDGAPSAIRALPRIRAAVGPETPLIFDSGLRSGEDVVKALALGADFTMFGRAALFSIGADGARGLSTLLDVIAEEIDITLAQIGVADVAELDARALAEWD